MCASAATHVRRPRHCGMFSLSSSPTDEVLMHPKGYLLETARVNRDSLRAKSNGARSEGAHPRASTETQHPSIDISIDVGRKREEREIIWQLKACPKWPCDHRNGRSKRRMAPAHCNAARNGLIAPCSPFNLIEVVCGETRSVWQE